MREPTAAQLQQMVLDAGNALSYLQECESRKREGLSVRRVLLVEAAERLAEVVEGIKKELGWEPRQAEK